MAFAGHFDGKFMDSQKLRRIIQPIILDFGSIELSNKLRKRFENYFADFHSLELRNLDSNILWATPSAAGP